MKSIFGKLVFWFVVISVVPLAVVAFLAHSNAERNIKAEIMNHLESTADNRVDQIQAYLRERHRIVSTLSRTPGITDAIERLDDAFTTHGPESPQYADVDRQVRPFLTYIRDSTGFRNLFLISPKGLAVFSVNEDDVAGANLKSDALRDSQLAKVSDRANTLLETALSDFDEHGEAGEPAAFVAAPVIRDGQVLGVVALQMSNREVYDMIQDYTGLGTTGETSIAIGVNGEVVFVAPLRHDPNAAFTRRVSIGSSLALPMQEAVSGRKGKGVTTDYRGTQILAVWRYLPAWRWGMVVKIDAGEAFASIAKLRMLALTVGIVAFLAVLVLALTISKTITHPINELITSTKQIGGGDLSHRAKIRSFDEIGQLAAAFNEMAEDLEKSIVSHDQIAQAAKELRAARTASLNIMQDIDMARQRAEQAEADIRQTAEELERSNKELDDFAYIASHDLKTPLRGINHYAGFVIEDYGDKLDDEGREKLETMQRLCVQMEALINTLMTYSRVGRLDLGIEPSDLNVVVQEIVDGLRVRLDEFNVDVRFASPLPTITCDRGRIGELFYNLINNAINYNDKDERWIEIGYGPYSGDGELTTEDVFYVRDNGIGIRDKHLDSVFRIFKRLHARDKYGGGTGAGLTFVKKTVERHGGRIWVESNLGEGTTFFFTLADPGNGQGPAGGE